MARRRRNSKRRSYRRRSRKNVWKKVGAWVWSKKRRGRKGRKGRKKAANKGRRGRRRSRRNGRRGRRHGRRNPGLSLTRPLGALTGAFNVNLLKSAAVMAGGAVGNSYLSGLIGGLDFVPSLLKTGPGSYALGLGSAGLLSAGVGMIAPRYAGQILAGAVMAEVARALKEFVLPKIGMGYFGDYLTPGNAASAMPLGYFGDYLTPGNAAGALPLGGLTGDDTVSEELAAFA